jgi:hypothetical protein
VPQVITSSGVVLKGAGPGKTSLLMRASMTDLYGNDW